jgi:WD40 repeat protein
MARSIWVFGIPLCIMCLAAQFVGRGILPFVEFIGSFSDSEMSVAWSPTDTFVATGGNDGFVTIIDRSRGEVMETLPPGSSPASLFAWNGKGDTLFYSRARRLLAWDMVGRRETELVPGAYSPRASTGVQAAAACGMYLAYAFWEGGLEIIDLLTPASPSRTVSIEQGIKQIIWNSRCTRILMVQVGKDAQVLDLSSDAQSQRLTGHPDAIYGLVAGVMSHVTG